MKQETEPFVLRKHNLTHIPDLRAEKGFLGKRLSAGCAMSNCNGRCCKNGVMADSAEKERILAHKDLVLKYMEPQQEHNADAWFEPVDEVDADFPSGRGVGTQARETGCVFLDSGGLCTLQKAAMSEGMPKFFLKPFFCVAYPVTIEDKVLITDDPDFTERTQCCSTVESGSLTVLDVCREELEFMLGREGLEELDQHARIESASP